MEHTLIHKGVQDRAHTLLEALVAMHMELIPEASPRKTASITGEGIPLQTQTLARSSRLAVI